MDLFDPPYQKHSPTSRAAAEAIKPALNALQSRVLAVIRLEPSWGATDEDICTVTGLKGSTVRPRRIELCEKGLIKDSGKTRATKRGRQATVWTVA